MKIASATAIILLIILLHLGAIGILISSPGLSIALFTAALVVIGHLVAKYHRSRWSHPIGRMVVFLGAATLLITGAALVLGGFVIAHLCNANINLWQVCAYPRQVDFICHKVGPALLLGGLAASLALHRRAAHK
jgi:mannose/fructose/N-acetylgalactosamine-specific phosphotransferase system component IID